VTWIRASNGEGKNGVVYVGKKVRREPATFKYHLSDDGTVLLLRGLGVISPHHFGRKLKLGKRALSIWGHRSRVRDSRGGFVPNTRGANDADE